MRKFFVTLLLFLTPAMSWAQSPLTQCVSTAVAGGTSDALTIPQLPCTATSTLLVLTLTATNTTTSPTLAQIGVSAPQVILNGSNAGALTAGQLQAGGHVLLQYNGLNWFLLSSIISGSIPTGTTINSPNLTGTINSSGELLQTGRAIFANGQPWADATAPQFGTCLQNGSQDCSTSVNAAINFMLTNYGGGVVVLPDLTDGGVYCVPEGIALQANVTLHADGAAAISVCAGNVPTVTMSGSNARLEVPILYGQGAFQGAPGATFGASQPVVLIESSCVRCQVRVGAGIIGGVYGIEDSGSDTNVENTSAFSNYGACYFKISDALWARRLQCDSHAWYFGIPAYPYTINNWPSNTPVSAGDVYSIGGYWIQVGTGGTTQTSASFIGTLAGTTLTVSSGTNPTVPVSCSALTPDSCSGVYGTGVKPGTYIVSGSAGSYVVNYSQTTATEAMTTGPGLQMFTTSGTNIIDGTAHEAMIGPSNSATFICDTDGAEIHIDQSDFSSADLNGFISSNSGSGTPCHTLTLEQSAIATQVNANFNLVAGYDWSMKDDEILGCLAPDCGNVTTASSWVSGLNLIGEVELSNGGYGLLDQAGSGTTLMGNGKISSEGVTGAFSSQQDLVWIGNSFSNTPQAMNVTSAVTRGSVIGNNCHGATAGLTGAGNIPAGSGVNANPVSGNQGC